MTRYESEINFEIIIYSGGKLTYDDAINLIDLMDCYTNRVAPEEVAKLACQKLGLAESLFLGYNVTNEAQ